MPTVEQQALIKSRQRRLETYNIHKKFISNLRNSKGRSYEMKYRRWFGIILTGLSDEEFVTVKEEKDYIGVYRHGSRVFNCNYIDDMFDEIEEEIIMSIAVGYGAFDYSKFVKP